MTEVKIENNASIIDIILALVKSPQQFTDIHIEQDEVIAWHVPFGFKKVKEDLFVSREMIESFLNTVLKDWKTQMDVTGSVDYSTVLTNCRLRINAYYTREKNRISLSVRKHPLEAAPIDKSPLSPIARRMLALSSKGLFIVTGSTGSAKTTTLASIIHYFNNEATINNEPRRLHILTIEEPVEYIHERNNGMISHKSVGSDCPTFAQGLRAALREKPDVILIGEVRDRETAEVMLQAAESGHLILATLHTNSAVSAIAKILSFFPDDESASRRQTLAANLIGVSSQVMLPVNNEFLVISESLINNNDKVSGMITDNKLNELQTYMDDGKDGSETLNNKLFALFEAKKISGEVAVKSSYDPVGMMMRCKSHNALSKGANR